MDRDIETIVDIFAAWDAEPWVPQKRRSALVSDQSATRRCNATTSGPDTASHVASTDQDYQMSTNDG
jgi:hypothetical protein